MSQLITDGSESQYRHLFYPKITRPSFISGLFPELSATVCVPMDAPFDDFAITQHGTVFRYRPLKTLRLNDLITIHPDAVCIYKYKKNGRVFITLPTSYGVHYSFFVDTLLMYYFNNYPLSNRLKINYNDENYDHLWWDNLYVPEDAWPTQLY